MASPMLIDADAIARGLDPRLLVERLRRYHSTGAMPEVRRALIEHDGGPNACLVWCGWLPEEVIVTKVATVFPGNAEAGKGGGLPNIHSLVTMFDATDGRPLAIVHGEMFTRMKTAADSALAADLLAGAEPLTLGVVGAGGQAETHVRFLLAVRPSIRRIRIANRSLPRAAMLAQALADTGRDITATACVEAVAREADIVTCLTAATAPVLAGDWLKPGAHVDLVGGYAPNMRESDDALIRRARLFADTRAFTLEVCGDFADPIARGVIAADRVEADLFDLCAPGGRFVRAPEDLTAFKNGGGGHLDSMVAAALLDIASNAGATP
jgi:ornithine cyclodeaminase/alanine dehydrogenase-like protein (mu-crystallin family)